MNSCPPLLVGLHSGAIEDMTAPAAKMEPTASRGRQRQISKAFVEVAGCQLGAELVTRLHVAGDLGEQLPPAVEYQPKPSSTLTAPAWSAVPTRSHGAPRPGRQAVIVKIPDRQGEAEQVQGLHRPAHLGEQLPAGGGEPTAEAVQRTDRTGTARAADGLEQGPNGQISEAVVVEVADGQYEAELVPDLGGATDLGEQAASSGRQAAGRARQHADRTSTSSTANSLTRSADSQSAKPLLLKSPAARAAPNRSPASIAPPTR